MTHSSLSQQNTLNFNTLLHLGSPKNHIVGILGKVLIARSSGPEMQHPYHA